MSSETDFLVLQKIPYGERGVILKGISAEDGRGEFMAYGAIGGTGRTFPEIELFRLLRIASKPGRGDLPVVGSVEILEDYSGITQRYPAFLAASWIASFSLMNVMTALPHPFYMNSVCVALRRLAEDATLCTESILTCVALSFLFEEGWLSSLLENKESAGQLRRILEMAAGKEPPVGSAEEWSAQFEWCRDVLLLNECRLPENRNG